MTLLLRLFSPVPPRHQLSAGFRGRDLRSRISQGFEGPSGPMPPPDDFLGSMMTCFCSVLPYFTALVLPFLRMIPPFLALILSLLLPPIISRPRALLP